MYALLLLLLITYFMYVLLLLTFYPLYLVSYYCTPSGAFVAVKRVDNDKVCYLENWQTYDHRQLASAVTRGKYIVFLRKCCHVHLPKVNIYNHSLEFLFLNILYLQSE